MSDVPALLLSLHRLQVSPVDAPSKRAAGSWNSARLNSAHHSVAEVLLSRLLTTANDEQLRTIARSRYGDALLVELRGVARVACLGAGANSALVTSHVAQLFRATGSSVMQPAPYASVGLGIESVLPHAVALRVYRELDASVTAVRSTPVGVAMEAALVTQGGGGGGGASDVEAASTIVQCVEAVRSELFRRLRVAGDGASSSADHAGSSSMATAVAYEIHAAPLPMLQPNESLQSNVASLFEAWLSRTMSLGQHVAMYEAMGSALSVLIDGDANRRRAVLESQLLVALTTRGVLLLLAAIQEALASTPPIPTAFDAALQSVAARATAYATIGMGEEAIEVMAEGGGGGEGGEGDGGSGGGDGGEGGEGGEGGGGGGDIFDRLPSPSELPDGGE